MKKTLLGISLLFGLAGSSFAVTIDDIAGTYTISHPEIAVVLVVTIASDYRVTLEEQVLYVKLSCEGKATLEDDVVEFDVTCDNGASFQQQIDLNGVSDFNEFSAPVYSYLWAATFFLNFKRNQIKREREPVGPSLTFFPQKIYWRN